MTYFPAIGNGSVGIGVNTSLSDNESFDITQENLVLWLRSDNLLYDAGGLVTAWGSPVTTAPLTFIPDSGSSSALVVDDVANGLPALDFSSNKSSLSPSFEDPYTGGSSEVTIIVVAKFDNALSSNKKSRLVMKTPDVSFEYQLSVRESSGSKLRFGYIDESANEQEIDSVDSITIGQTQIYAATAKDNCNLYIDGDLSKTEVMSYTLDTNNSGYKLKIGNLNTSNNEAQKLFEVIIYNKELSEAELSPIFSYLKSRYDIA